jgi:hypothetical protein
MMLSRFGTRLGSKLGMTNRLRVTDGQRKALQAVRAGKDISAVTRRNLFRLRLINNSGELTPAGAAVLGLKPPRQKNFGIARKTLRLPVTAL